MELKLKIVGISKKFNVVLNDQNISPHAGHYVPQLAQQIQDYNKKSSNPIINLKGFIVSSLKYIFQLLYINEFYLQFTYKL